MFTDRTLADIRRIPARSWSAALAPGRASAQATGSITGLITDQSGARDARA